MAMNASTTGPPCQYSNALGQLKMGTGMETTLGKVKPAVQNVPHLVANYK